MFAHTGWADRSSSLVAITDDATLDLAELKRLLKRVEQTIPSSGIAPLCHGTFRHCGGHVCSRLSRLALARGRRSAKCRWIGQNTPNANPSLPEYIEKSLKARRDSAERIRCAVLNLGGE